MYGDILGKALEGMVQAVIGVIAIFVAIALLIGFVIGRTTKSEEKPKIEQHESGTRRGEQIPSR